MAHRDTILGFLGDAKGPICDDCLSDRTGITPRQTINMICRRLEKVDQIARDGTGSCHYCHGRKICNSLTKAPANSSHRPTRTRKTDDPRELWHWEGNIQAALVTWLAKQGWTIRSAADTAAKTAGKDIIAERDGRAVWVSVKGFPRGTPRTNPSTQARHWFSHAVFDLVLYRDEDDSVDLALGLPDGFPTYQKLADRVAWLRSNLPCTIYWVSKSGAVRWQ